MSSNFNKIQLGSNQFDARPYAECSTAASTVAKTVSYSSFELYNGASIIVKFKNGNSAASPTLNVNSQGAKNIRINGSNASSSLYYSWAAGAVLEFVYDGSYWNLMTTLNTDTNTDTNTTYSAGTGISLSGTIFSHADTNTNISKDTSYGPTANVTQSAKNNASFTVPQITLDQFGHVKSVSERTITVTDTDTHPTVGNGTVTIYQNNTSKGSFTMNQSGNTSIYLTDTDNDTNTHYTSKNIVGTSSTATSNGAVTGTGGVYLNHLEESTVKSTHKIVGSGSVKVTSDSNGNITITGTGASTDTNYYHTREYSSGLKISTGTGVSDMYVPTASTTQNGVMTTTMVTKLNGIATGATAVSSSTVSGWGFTKNAGTITGIKMNGSSKGTSGVVDLGTVITSTEDCVKTTGNQTIEGEKTFANTARFSGALWVDDLDKICYWDGATVQDALNLKQDSISDLATIRSNASNGATAYGWGNHAKAGYTKNTGTVTGVKINGVTKSPSSGIVNLGTVITSHQSLDSCVKTTGDQTIEGYKVFHGSIYVPELVNIVYSDGVTLQDALNLLVNCSEDQTIYGEKTFKNTTRHDGDLWVNDLNNIRYSDGVTLQDALNSISGGSTSSTDEKVKFVSTTTSGNYPLLMKYSTGTTTTAANARFNQYVTLNPSSRTLNVGNASGTSYLGRVNAGNGFFQTSDERLKDFHGNIPVDFEALKSIPKQYFTWKEVDDDVDNKLKIGTGAQSLQKIYPELVTENDGTLTVAYDKLSIVALAAIDKLHEENQELKERIEKLEQLISKLV